LGCEGEFEATDDLINALRIFDGGFVANTIRKFFYDDVMQVLSLAPPYISNTYKKGNRLPFK